MLWLRRGGRWLSIQATPLRDILFDDKIPEALGKHVIVLVYLKRSLGHIPSQKGQALDESDDKDKPEDPSEDKKT